LRIALLALGLLLSAGTFAQGDYRDVEIRYRTAGDAIVGRGVPRALMRPDGSAELTLAPPAGKPVSIVSQAQGLIFVAQGTITAVLTPDGTPQKRLRLTKVTGRQDVRVFRNASGGTYEISGSAFEFTDRANSGTLAVAGPVKLAQRITARGETTVATGSRLDAVLDTTPGATGNPIRTAKLAGRATVTAQRGAPASGTYTVRADRVDVTGSREQTTFNLSGNLDVVGDSEGDQATISNVERAVVSVDAQGNLLSAEIIGAPARAVLTPRGRTR
jgi:hypothetical protein